MIQILVTLYRGALALYPRRVRQVYAREQVGVFSDLLTDVSRLGWLSVLKIILQEFLDFPGNLIQAYLEDNMFNRTLNNLLRWSARIISILISAFLLYFFIGEAIPNILGGHATELIPFLPWLGMAVIGTVLIWFHERTGAVLMIVGAVAMAIYLKNGRMFMVYSLPYLLSGVLLFIRVSINNRPKTVV
jgi:hypothetical protein